ncbi:SNARE-interacting protein KEULE-like [Dioscorea cayenensis subsp. rotundata]|uniref:SNARE-interacting protein KEULE-like n=1 Tax=Dioscorea cayennensis subsp. rotundata TaxID=55577 RepID=A0AB40CJ30_DIOCR|nr:SNARE-interacting protein KEULE-like [Dioscorea cayenensis subsp. rotundata]XP_039138228.1 SNARE-interacting protein KEULE-like [Dioscorea cayenensis subsp. rotundata]XP_039138230.1 SNARE-interacting protein KEULE-like [Dioscorea cayenensis subsp. rotundata]
MSDSDSSHSSGDQKTFRQITRDRLLYEMLRSTRVKDSKSTWKVLVMDKLTVKIMSYSCKMADMTEEGVSLVEDLYKRRQPMPSMDAIYFIQPSKENVAMFLSDMSGKRPLYRKAYVFFSSPVSKDLVAHVKKDSVVLPRIGALSEMNLEYFAIDSQGFITDHENALEVLFGENADSSHKSNYCVNTMAIRIATAFASLREFPYVHYRAAKSSLDASTLTTVRDLAPTKLAAAVWNCLAKYKATIPGFPQKETCKLLIVDRSIDQIAPVIHEWTYDAMCHDLLNLDGNKYVYEVPGNNGSEPEKKEVLLEDHDPIWLELRHAHIAEASEKLHEKMTNFITKNKAAQIHHHSRDGGELSTRDLQKMVRALPQYSEQIEKLSLHVEIAGKLNRLIRDFELRELGQLEQDLVFGDAGSKEVMNFLKTKQDISSENKLRLLMVYAAIYPEKLAGEKVAKMMQLARLSRDEMDAVNNMRFLGVPDTKKTSGGVFSLKFDVYKKRHGARKERNDEEETWQLSRFYPMIEELIQKLTKDELPKHEYPCMNDPVPTIHGFAPSSSFRTAQPQSAYSMRSRRTAATWARPRNSDDGYSSDSVLRHASSDLRKMGQRIFVFIIGGATRSELRAVHKLSVKLKREIILGSTSIDDPSQFVTKLKNLNSDELSLDDLQI